MERKCENCKYNTELCIGISKCKSCRIYKNFELKEELDNVFIQKAEVAGNFIVLTLLHPITKKFLFYVHISRTEIEKCKIGQIVKLSYLLTCNV